MHKRLCGERIRISGTVQGVGFRPTVWQIALDEEITGRVWNGTEGVLIEAWGSTPGLERFCSRIIAEPPPLARIESLERSPLLGVTAPEGFSIVASRGGAGGTGVAADAATCPACLAEVMDPDNRRYRYPFTNCTHCGPRLSIIRAIPYDRAHTSMASFTLCPACQREYDAPADRRFHAQPNACPECGPQLWLHDEDGRVITGETGEDAIAATVRLLRAGAIIAIKGIGGFQLACDATSDTAVSRLRERKQRYHKPFALMVRDTTVVARYATPNQEALQLLGSNAAPIVVVAMREGGEPLAAAIAPGQNTLGFMLPHTPLHHLLMVECSSPLVMTSGNRSSEPQVIDNREALQRLHGIADYWLCNDRAIVNRLDDSVLRVIAGRPRTLRRARGYAPEPLRLPPGFETVAPLLAMGAEQKNSFCILKEGKGYLSQHLGDLEEALTLRDYRHTIDLYRTLYDVSPEQLVVDLHPDYLSTQLGRQLAELEGVPLVEVQHHHAHIAAAMAEHGIPIDTPPLLGIALDGLGLGADGTLWGGEFLLADYSRFRRLAHLRSIPMPGGRQAIIEPWRNSYAQLHTCLGWDQVQQNFSSLESVAFLATKPLANLNAMIDRGLNTPLASSSGRLFDAVAAVLGLCRESVAYEGEAAVLLEAEAARAQLSVDDPGYPFTLQEGALATLDPTPLWQALLSDLAVEVPLATMAARFHRGLAEAIVSMVRHLARSHTFDLVVLGGGVWQNRLLFEEVGERLDRLGINWLAPQAIPANDGGIALGQAVVAAARGVLTE